MSGYESEYGKDAWKDYRRILERADMPMQAMLHEFGEEMYEQGRKQGARDAHPWMADWTAGNKQGWVDALNAAYDAVAAVGGDWVFGPRIYKHEALTVIRTLIDPRQAS